MPILTLTTDYGTKSFDVAALKGKLMSASTQTNIIDITHSVTIFDKMNAAYALKNASSHFPSKTIHFTNINLKEGNNRYLIVLRNSHYFICPDNGLITMMFPDEDFKAFAINDLEKDFSYQEINDKLCEILKSAENNEDLTQFGTATKSYFRASLVRPSVTVEQIKATVIHIDRYGNAIVNVTKDMFYKYIETRPFTISVRGNRAHRISKHYAENEPGEMVCIFNDAGLLEIAINSGKATQLLGLEYGSIILIEKL